MENSIQKHCDVKEEVERHSGESTDPNACPVPFIVVCSSESLHFGSCSLDRFDIFGIFLKDLFNLPDC